MGRRNKKAFWLMLSVVLFSCRLKSKTELYLERDLDILSNKKEVNFVLKDDILIEEIGVIRDLSQNSKTLILKLGDSVSQKKLENYIIGVKSEIKNSQDKKRIEYWDFSPVVVQTKKSKYLLRPINIAEDKVHQVKIYLYRSNDSSKIKLGNLLTIRNLYTYND